MARLLMLKAEDRAMRWAARFLMSRGGLGDALSSGITRINDLADHFQVTEQMAHFRLRLSRTTGEVLWGGGETHAAKEHIARDYH